jgi:hypothetical protein
MFKKIALPSLMYSPVYSSTGNQLQIQTAPRILKKNEIASGPAYLHQEKLFYEKETGDEIHLTLFL